ncbi:LPXTG cell wall anchor domain-containing protein [Micromonospora sp. WMMC241]|uniref:LPXTG cell wall anchor domain-containing protein n=1 Tax=Micromonospora sp. WMMC241 TaxID=3015159 RepID=UPI0022B60D56|nr:LPXTG cell wall anchor domain-containing protein [Micromonospora sp. WMMC241]MCZ7440486.1 LPXTG cell wall anchor domain-containing protein [Micromonospora sp. WMMC241]
MLSNSTRRWFAGLGVVGAFVAASATPALAAPPALPEPPADDLLLYANGAIVAPGGPAKAVTLYAFTEALPKDVTVTVDHRAVDAFADVTLTDRMPGCADTAGVLTCQLKGADVIDYVLDLTVKAKDEAAEGAKGDLLLSLAPKGGKAVSTRSTVEIGEGVDLRAPERLGLTGAPGATVRTSLGVANIGDRDVHGTVLLLATMPTLTPTTSYRNCSSVVDFGSTLTVCRFDDDIPAGAARQVDSSSALKIAGDAWAPSRQYGSAFWFTGADFEEFAADVLPPDGWQPGSGSALTLVPAPSAQARSLRQTDNDPTNNVTSVEVDVTGNQRADLAATGAELPGTPGRTVTAEVGFVNNGPAMANTFTPGEVVTIAQVTVPAGAKVVKAPEGCSPGTLEEPTGGYGEPGARVYSCEWYDVLHKGDAAVFAFGLKIVEAGGAPGKVELRHFDLGDKGQVADLNPKNDTAALVVGAAEGGQGGGGTLPITGSSTGLIAGIGALLLAGGAAGYVVSRRRRTHFVA